MSTFLERLKDEKTELNDKVTKLTDFIEKNPIFNTTSKIQQELLRVQLIYMGLYLNILEKRIADLSRVMYDNFFDWWEEFTEMAHSNNLEISEEKDKIRDKWNESKFSVEYGVKHFTR